MPKVSIIIPSYNSLDYLPEALDSALQQTFRDIEVIIVNDGSTDGTEQWVLAQAHPQVKLFSQENLGKSAARNRGLAESTGNYVAFLDADDIWEPTKLEKQVRCLGRNPQVGLVYTWTALADSHGRPTGRILASTASGKVWRALVLKNILACGSTPMVRRQCFDKAGGFSPDLPLAQDWDMWIRIASHDEFAVIKEPLVRYRKHDRNTSTKWALMHTCSCLVLERAFKAAPVPNAEIADIYDRAHTSLYLYLGWLAIRKQADDQARFFWQKSQETASSGFSKDTMRLRVTLFVRRWLGKGNYYRLQKVFYGLRRSLSTLRV
ncbi:MAG: glycosyltransferase family A protein [Cyanobacteria bacterium J06628_6]